MRRLAPVLLVTLALAACQSAQPSAVSAPLAQKTAYTGTLTTVDPAKSTVSFVGKSSIVDHPGVFERFTAKVTPAASAPTDFTKATLEFTIDLTSVKTDSAGLDGHMQKEDFFNTAKHPQATFRSTAIVAQGDNRFAVTGDLTIKGITKSLTADTLVTDEGLTAEFEIPRKDYSVAADSYKDKLLDEMVPVTVTLVFTR